MKIAVIPNTGKEKAIEYAKSLIPTLRNMGAEILLSKQSNDEICDKQGTVFSTAEQAIENSDIVIALGGDGTIIRIARFCAIACKPLLGINFGRLGFVADLEPDEAQSLKKLFSGEYEIEKRMILQVTLTKNNEKSIHYAINDAVISKGGCSRLIDLKVYLNGNRFNSFRADGVIFSTPTGSTAYALSAGGPVVDPAMDCICLVPICPHSLFSRSVVFNSESVLSVKQGESENSEIFLTLDGHEAIRINPDDLIEVKKADIYAGLIKLKDKGFYTILNDKLNVKNSDF